MTGSGVSTRPLSWRAEARRQLRRRRTAWAYGLLVALPLVFVGAFTLGEGGRGGGARFVDLAKLSSANFSVFALFASAEFLLVLVAALFAGDTVPSEASWSSLRYLLSAPVSRARLLTSKLVVALASTAAAVLLLTGWSLLVGGLAYGWDGYTSPTGSVLPWAEFLPKLMMAVLAVFLTLLQVVGIAFLLGTLTDAPLGAVGGAVLVVILASILDAIDALGDLRRGLPLHYSRSWLQALAPSPDWTEIQRGVLWSLIYTLLTVGAAYWWFGRKDVLS